MPVTLRVFLWGLAAFGVGVLALGAFAPRVARHFGPSSLDAAQMQLKGLSDGVQMYYLDHRVLPPSLDALTALSKRTGEPYIDKIPNDPWNHEYEYAIVDATKQEFRLRSLGPDGRPSSDDDLLYPAETER
jgi:general secretion pathway protein G